MPPILGSLTLAWNAIKATYMLYSDTWWRGEKWHKMERCYNMFYLSENKQAESIALVKGGGGGRKTKTKRGGGFPLVGLT